MCGRNLPPGLSAKRSQRISLRDVNQHPWISLSESSWLYRYSNKSPEFKIIVNDMLAAVELVRLGVGIAMVPSYMITGVTGLQVQRVKRFKGASICLLLRRYEREPEEISEFLAMIKKHSSAWQEIY